MWKRILAQWTPIRPTFIYGQSQHRLPPNRPSNLRRWSYKVISKCPLCHVPHCNIKHVLNCCPTALTQGRYTWRHDKILHLLYQFVKASNPDASIYCDLEGLRATDSPPSTIPPSLLFTTTRPDLTLFYEDKGHLVELTVPWNSTENLAGARHHK